MSRLIALAGLATYTCQTVVNHDGKDLPPGSPIELDTAAAQQLLDVQAIGYADGTAPQALQATTTGQAGADLTLVNDLAQELTEAREAHAREVAQLQALLVDVRQAAANDQAAGLAEAAGLREGAAAARARVTELEADNLALRETVTANEAVHAANVAGLTQQLADAQAKAAKGGTKQRT